MNSLIHHHAKDTVVKALHCDKLFVGGGLFFERVHILLIGGFALSVREVAELLEAGYPILILREFLLQDFIVVFEVTSLFGESAVLISEFVYGLMETFVLGQHGGVHTVKTALELVHALGFDLLFSLFHLLGTGVK
jgi:hypothetical protein